MSLLLIVVFLFSIFGLLLALTLVQKHRAKQLLQQLNAVELTHMPVQFMQSQYSKYSGRGGTAVRGELYFNADIMILCPAVHSYFGGLHYLNLPLVFSVTPEKVAQQLGNLGAIAPDKCILTEWGALRIKYRKKAFGTITFDMTIKTVNKKDRAKLTKISVLNMS